MTTKDWNIDFIELAERHPATADLAVFEFIKNLLSQECEKVRQETSNLFSGMYSENEVQNLLSQRSQEIIGKLEGIKKGYTQPNSYHHGYDTALDLAIKIIKENI